ICMIYNCIIFCFFFQAEDGIRDGHVTGVQTCALPILGEVWISNVTTTAYWEKDMKNKDGYQSYLPSVTDFSLCFAVPQALNEQRSEEHTSELQSRGHLVCRLLLEKKNKKTQK